MNTIHDLGGMDGFTLPERDQGRILQEEWERELWGLVFAISAPGYRGGQRVDIERIPPERYLTMPYYAKWLQAEEQALIDFGLVTREELDNPDGPVSIPDFPDHQPRGPEEMVARLASDDSYELDAEVPPLFSVGDDVIVKNEHPTGHTRVPRYVRGHHGVIHKHHGVHRFLDEVEGKDVGQQHLYTVMFTGSELWGSRAHPKDRIYAELWDYHLKPASQGND
jgi:nitrile hydratase subunit beta